MELSGFIDTTNESTPESFVPYYLGKTGKEWWLLPNSTIYNTRIGPYTSDTEPTSMIGSRWTITQNKTRYSNPTTSILDTFEASQGEPASIDQETNTWKLGSYNTGLSADEYDPPKCKCSIWKWTISSKLPVWISEKPDCPFSRRPEYGLWSNGTKPNLQHAIDVNDVDIKIAPSPYKIHWWLDGNDTGISYDENRLPIMEVIQPTQKGSDWEFIWKVTDADDNVIELARTSNCKCPVVPKPAMTWWVVDKNGNERDTEEDALDPVALKGLEADGIASRNIARTEWNEEEQKWEDTPETLTSWTPLASLFVDAYRETSYGILESIRHPWNTTDAEETMKKGMVWEVETSEDLFGEEGVHIVDMQTNSWNAYKEGEGAGNIEAPSFAVYIGWKQNEENPELYNSYCTICSLATGAKVKWKVMAKDWRFQNLELVLTYDGMLNHIVIMGTKGWIVSSGQFSLANGGREIKSVVWNTPCNPVAEVLQELEKIVAYKWLSWDSNTESEFAAVGSFGVYVYSEDCITFKASIPYGQDAVLSEVVWDPDAEEFKIWGVAIKVEIEGDETTTIENESGSSSSSSSSGSQSSSNKDDDFESAYEDGAVINWKSSSISVTTVSDTSIYKHKHTTAAGDKETLYYTFSSAITSFEQLDGTKLSKVQKESAFDIVPDSPYRYSKAGKTWTFIYSKCRASNGEVLGSGFSTKGVQWKWMWNRKEEKASAEKLSYITISKNRKAVAYGFPDLVRFIRSYKKTYNDAMEFVGTVCQYASSKRDSVDENGKALEEAYEALAKMDGFKLYSTKLPIAWQIYKHAEKLRDASHYVENDCYNVYLQRIGQSLALEYKDYFNKAKRAMWTAQAFKNYYEKLAKQGIEMTVK